MVNKAIKKWEELGIAVIFIVGGFLHFLFQLSGEWAPVGAIAAINESVWEHFKIGFWAASFYMIFEYFKLRNSYRNFFFAKAIGIYIIPGIIAADFYSYATFTGHHNLAVDIIIFFIAIAAGQTISYYLSTIRTLPRWCNKLGLAMIIIMAATFIIVTYYPPHLPIFQDPVTGTYGIP